MRSFFLLPLVLSTLVRADTARSQAINFGRSEHSFVEARDVEAALEVLRRANYNFDDHVFDKRSGSYTYKSKGDICYCKPEHSHSSTKKSHPKSTTKKSHPKTTTYSHTPPGNHQATPTGSHHDAKPTHHHHTTSSSDKGHQKHHDHWTSSSSSSAPTSKSTDKPSCPSGYKNAGKGDTFISNDNDVVDASDLSIVIDILDYSSPSATPVKSTKPAKDDSKCEAKYCCYKSGKGSSSGSSTSSSGGNSGKGSTSSGGKATCSSGYTSYSQGDTIIKNDNDVVDLSDLTIDINILSYTSSSASPVSKSYSGKTCPTKCDASTCCVKQTSKKNNTVISNDNDVVDASGATVKVCILSICS